MTIPQTTYPDDMPRGLEGDVADTGADNHTRTRTNTTADMEFGRGVMAGAADNTVVLPTAVAANFEGITRFSHVGSNDTSSTGIPQNTPANILTKGRIRVVPEVTVSKNDPVYLRYQNAGADPEAIGRFTNIPDTAVAKVVTATVTAVNDTDYQLTLHFPDNEEFVWEASGDGTATATEINNDLRAKMAADAGFTARCVATGTTTLILTGQVAGEDFTVEDSGPGAWASITDTTPAVAGDTVRLDLVHSIRWVQGGTSADGAVLELNMP